MKENILLDKSFTFAVRVVNLYKYLCSDKKESDNILEDLIEILKLLTSIIKTTKENIKNEK